MWCRVFSLSPDPLPAAALAEQVQHLAPHLRCAFHGDDQGWFRVELFAPDHDDARRTGSLLGDGGRHPRAAEHLGGLAGGAGGQPAHAPLMQQRHPDGAAVLPARAAGADAGRRVPAACAASWRGDRRRLPGGRQRLLRRGRHAAGAGVRHEQRREVPAARSHPPGRPARPARQVHRRGLPRRPARQPVPRLLRRVLRASQVRRPATTSRTSTGTSTPRPTSTTSRSSRPRPTSPATW